MTRLVAAILILFAVLMGLKAANSSLFQNSLFGQNNSNAMPETRNTGFNSEATGANTNNAGVSSTGLNAPNQVNTNTPNQVGIADTTPLPPESQSAVRAGW